LIISSSYQIMRRESTILRAPQFGRKTFSLQLTECLVAQ
jgi:hypothetical protein